MGNPVYFLGWNTSGGGQRVVNGDEYLEYNFTETASSTSILTLQRNANTFFELLNDSGVKVSSASSYLGSTTPSLDVQGLLDHPAGFIRLYDKTGGQDALVVKRTTNSTGRVTELLLGNASQDSADSVGARFNYNAQTASPLGKVAAFGFTGVGPGYAFNELLNVNSDGTVHLAKSSGANLVWDTDGGGTVGGSTANRPSTVYAATSVVAPTLYGGTDATYKSALTAYSLTLSGATPGSNNKVIYADDGTGTPPAIQFDESTNQWQYRLSGGAFSNFGGVSTWDAVYDNDSDGLTIDTSAKPFVITQISPSTNCSVLTISRNLIATSFSSAAVKITNSHASDVNPALHIVQNGGYAGANYYDAAIYVNPTGANSKGICVRISGSASTAYPQYSLYNDTTSIWDVTADGIMTLRPAVAAVSGLTIQTPISFGWYNTSRDALSLTGGGGLNVNLTSVQVLARSAIYAKIAKGVAIGSDNVIAAITADPVGYGGTDTGFLTGFMARLVTSNSTTAHTAAFRANASEYRYGVYLGSLFTVPANWTAIDKSAVVIEGSNYNTVDSYGIVCTTVATERPSTILAGGKTALLVGTGWDYGTYSLSPVAASSFSIGPAAAATDKYIYAKQASTNPGLRYLSSTSKWQLSNDGTNWYDLLGSGTLAPTWDAIYAVDQSLDINSTVLTFDQTATTGIGFTVSRATGTADNAVMLVSNATAAQNALQITSAGAAYAVSINNTHATLGSARALLVNGLTSFAKTFGAQLNESYNLVTGFVDSSASALLSGARLSIVDVGFKGNAADDASSQVRCFSASGDSTAGPSTVYGFYADTNNDIGVYSAAPVIAVRSSLATDNATVYSTFVDTPTALNAAAERTTYSSDLRGSASDNATSLSSSYRANIASGETTGGTFTGFHALSGFTYGLYSQSSTKVSLDAVDDGNDYTASLATITSPGLTSGGSMFGVSASYDGNASDTSGTIFYSFTATGAKNSGSAGLYGFYATATMDYGLYSLSKSLVQYTGNTAAAEIFRVNMISTALGAGTTINGVSVRTTGHASDDATSVFKLFSARGDNLSGDAQYYGYYVDSKCDIGLYSEARSYIGATSVSNSNALQVNIVTAAALDTAGKTRSAIQATPLTHASDVTGSFTTAITAIGSSTSAGSSTGCGFFSDEYWDYGWYSKSKCKANVIAIDPQSKPAYTIEVYSDLSQPAYGSYGGVYSLVSGTATDPSSTVVAGVIGDSYSADTTGIAAGFYAPSNSDYGLYSLSPLYVKGTLANTTEGIHVTNTSAALTAGDARILYFAYPLAHASDLSPSSTIAYRADGAAATGVGLSTTYAFSASNDFDYGVYSLSPSYFERIALATAGSASCSGSFAADPPAITPTSYQRSVFDAALRGNASDVAGSRTIAFKADLQTTGGVTTGGKFVGLYATVNLHYGIESLAEANLLRRTNAYWVSSGLPVLTVENNNTATSTAPAIHASIARGVDGMYAIEMSNSGTSDTKYHIGFARAVTNVRVLPIASFISHLTDFSYWGASGNTEWAATGNTKYMTIPLLLPHGCTLTNIDVYQSGGGGTAATTDRPLVSLYRKTYTTATTATIQGTTAYAATNGIATISWTGAIVLDNSTYEYFIRYRNVNTGSTAGSGVYGVQVTYTIQDLGAAPGY
jgi:hypothetical protein